MLDILAVLSVRTAYDKYRRSVADHTISKEAKQILNDMGEYFRTFPNIDIVEWDAFETWFSTLKHSSYKHDVLQIYRDIFEKLNNHTVSAVTEEVVRSFIEKDFAVKAADLALKISDGTETDKIKELRGLVEQYETAAQVTQEEEDDANGDLVELIQKVSSVGNGYNWRLNSLNKSLGPLRKGNLVVVGKRPETGGTTFAASEATHIASQLQDDQLVLWFNNEEDGESAVKPRIISAAIGQDRRTIEADPKNAVAEYLAVMGGIDRMMVRSPSYLSTSFIDKVLKEYSDRVKLIVIDQLWKVHGSFGKNTSDVQKITGLFNRAREWAKEYAPVIAIHQADGGAENCRYIEMDQLYMSRTGVQGEADAIITLGRTNEPGFDNTRFINVPKNKLPGGPMSDPALRHGQFEVRIDKMNARFLD